MASRGKRASADRGRRAEREPAWGLSPDHYRILVERTLAGVYVIQDGRIAYVNERCADIFGYPVQEAIGKPLLDLVAPESRTLVEEQVRRRLEGEVESLRYEARCIHRSGARLDVEVFGTLAEYAGRPAIVGTLLDRTEERRGLEALAVSERRYRMLMEDAADGIFLNDRSGRFVDVNARGCAMLGYERHELLGMNFAELIPPEDLATTPLAFDKALRGEAVHVERRVRRKDGALLDVEVHGKLLPDGTLQAIVRDVSARRQAERTLREQTAILRAILDSMGDGVAVADAAGSFLIWNPAATRITGRALLGSPLGEWVATLGGGLSDACTPYAPCDVPLARALRGESTDAAEMFLRFPGRPEGLWLSITGRPVRGEDGSEHGGVIVFRDITAARRMLEDLRSAELRYRTLVETLPVVVYTATWEPLGATLYMSPQVQAKLGYPREDWLRDPDLWLERLHPEDRDRVRAALVRCRESGERFACTYRMLARDGRVVWFQDEGIVVAGDAGGPPCLQGVRIDVTDRETERATRERLVALSTDLVAVQEAERRAIARELHDEISQVLTGLKMSLERVAERPPADLPRVLAGSTSILAELMQRVRQMSLDLRPTVLDDLGLLAALRWHIDRYTSQTRIAVQLDTRGLERRRLDPALETAAYRIVQEGLTNVARHAGVRQASVRGWLEDGQLGVQVQDAGAGFDAEAACARGTSRGLAGMRERVQLLGGEFLVESAPGRGTQLTAEFPVAQNTPDSASL